MYGYGGIAYMWCAMIIVNEPSMARLIPSWACQDVVKNSKSPLCPLVAGNKRGSPF
jgi:hypothetical protein